MLVAIDTSVLIGILDARDVWHGAALRLHDALLAERLPLVYFDCVLAEASSTVARRLREQRRESELPGLLEQLRAEFPPERLTWLFPDVPRLYGQVMEQMHQRQRGKERNTFLAIPLITAWASPVPSVPCAAAPNA